MLGLGEVIGNLISVDKTPVEVVIVTRDSNGMPIRMRRAPISHINPKYRDDKDVEIMIEESKLEDMDIRYR